MGNKKVSKVSTGYYCIDCNYNTLYKCNYNKHLLTAKHKLLTNGNEKVSKVFKCLCGKEYTNRHSLCRHKKNCNFKIESIDSNMIIDIIKENQEIKKLLIEQNNNANITNQLIEKFVTNPPSNIMTNSTNHSNNNNNSQFNINIFLNEKCKDAINFSDFIENVEVTNEHLENNAQQGFVKGITKIIMDSLKDLSIFERPIHCSDVKREVMYIKDDDKWEKEEDNKKMCEAIQEITRKSLLQFQQWKQENPECNDLDSETGVKYMAIHSNSMAGSKREEFYPKIIKAVAKETVIDRKECL